MANATILEAGGWRWVKGASRRWQVRPDGVHIDGRDGPLRRAKGQGTGIAQKVWDAYGEAIMLVANSFKVDPRIIIATVCIESAGKVDAERYEAHLKDWSFGLTQTLTATAFNLGRLFGFPRGDGEWDMPTSPVPSGGDVEQWKRFLFRPLMSLGLCGAYHSRNDKHFKCDGDPVVIYCCYNAGSPRFTDKNAWGLVNYGSAVDAFAGFYGHACDIDVPAHGPVSAPA